ncbi:hypothetical protein HU200_061057 [Digitaria exilis]|uniref:DUF6598 domain-containing protein n=1 Tax=Digitaria exilis TaxID=1010633 RepID=A0A835DY96_9POAL|nr:hypothetical protein HU200_061057 [Digitaria exilis]
MRETRLGPMRVSDPTDICHTCWSACRQHVGCTMMQIFSLKLSDLPRGAAAELAMAPFSSMGSWLSGISWTLFATTFSTRAGMIHSPSRTSARTPSYISSPTTGIYLQCPVLIEYDMRIKQEGEGRHDDPQVIDGACTLRELTLIHGATNNRINGDGGARVDIARALPQSVEAMVEVWMVRLGHHGSDLELSITGFVGQIPEEIKIFRVAVGNLCDPKRFVVAVRLRSALFMFFKALAL